MKHMAAGRTGLSGEQLGHLTLLAQISAGLNRSYELEQVLGDTVDRVMQLIDAERGCIMLDRGGEAPEVLAIRGATEIPVRLADFPFSRSVVDQVLKTGEPVVCLDAGRDRSSSESLILLGTRSVLCVPIRSRERVIGLIYLDHRTSVVIYNVADLQVLEIVADMVAATVERARFFEAAVHGEKLAAIGTLLAGIVHELNNPLTTICLTASLLQETCPDPDLEIISNQAAHCQNLVKKLLRLSRPEAVELGLTRVEPIVRDVVKMLSVGLRGEACRLTSDLPASLPAIRGNAEELTQVLINLVSNAVDAVRGRPEPLIVVRAKQVDDFMRLTVEDNGPGIARNHLRRIFDPFFTTKPADRGTGLGLSIVRRIVAEHGGQVYAHNLPGGGACFTVELPLGEAREPMGPQAGPVPPDSER
ncbi:MAG: HAMP domain-containing sensor histidine kinase [Candidatus Eremiobacterota bacterium]